MRAVGHTAHQEGFDAQSILDNPYWLDYPKPSKLGREDEYKARMFVDGYCARLRTLIEGKAND